MADNVAMKPVEHFPEGVYFGMDEEVYHSLPMLSASAMKNILISPCDFYYRSWLNKERDDEQSDTMAMIIGRAYHKRILEGKAAFDKNYCPVFAAPDGCLVTIDDLKAALLRVGNTGKSSFKKPDWIMAVQTFCPEEKILEVEKQKYEATTGGRTQLSVELMERIELAAAMIEKHPAISKCFSNGYPEVTVIWQEKDLWFKARFDYFRMKAITDLKTFMNQQNKPIDIALYHVMANYKYHIQAAHYLNAAEKAVQFAREYVHKIDEAITQEGDDVRIRCIGGQIVPLEFLRGLSKTEQHDFYFVFQQKGVAPLARGKKFERGSMYGCGQAAIEQAIEMFKRYYSIYGDGVWVDAMDITSFEDAGFPPWATEL